MKKQLIILFIIIISTAITIGQSLSISDSLKLSAAIELVFENFESPDFNEFENISTDVIYCMICEETQVSEPGKYFFNRKEFFDFYIKTISQYDIWERALNSKKIFYHKTHSRNKKFGDMIAFFTVWEKDEWAKGHEVAVLGLQFKIVDEEFKFAGIETIP